MTETTITTPSWVQALDKYVASKPIEDVAADLGLKPEEIIMLVANVVSSCSFSKKQIMNKAEANDSCKIEVVVLDPGHFHASLLQKETLTDVSDTIRIYAPEGIAVNQYLESIDSYNQRAESPPLWNFPPELYIS